MHYEFYDKATLYFCCEVYFCIISAVVTAVPSGGNFNSTIVHHGNAPAVSLHASPLLRTQLLAELIKNTTETLAAEIITIISKEMRDAANNVQNKFSYC